MKLFHGTTAENADAIKSCGFINGPVFMTPNYSTAADYAGDGEVIEVTVDNDELMIDLDLPGAMLLTVDDACQYLDEEDRDIYWFIKNGYSVGVIGSVSI